MPGLSDLLADPSAVIELVVRGSYLDENGSLQTEWISRSGWHDEPAGPAGIYIPPLLEIDITINRQIDPLNPKSLLDGDIAELNLINNSIYSDYAGRYDYWHRNTVDHLEWIIYIVGFLSDGTIVNINDVVDSPLYSLIGEGRPEVGSGVCKILVQSKAKALKVPIQRQTFSYPCPVFAGVFSTADAINLGNVHNIEATTSRTYWFFVDDPSKAAMQFLSHKDSGTQGHYVIIGLVGGGTIQAGVELCVRGQTPATTTSVANVLTRGWHRLDLTVDLGANTRTIYLDGAVAAGPTSTTGSPIASSVNHYLGYGLKGSMSRFLAWSVAKTSTQLGNLGRVPITGKETNLSAYYPLDEGVDLTVYDRKLGSSATGTLGANVEWGDTAWHYAAILGTTVPTPIGRVPRVPVVWIDPPKQIGQFGSGASALVSEIQSNHGVVSPGNYVIDLQNSTVQITSGALSGTYTATVTAANLWNSALLFSSTSTALATINSPTGRRSMHVQARLDSTITSVARYLCGWFNGSVLPGSWFARADTGNKIGFYAWNDAGTLFTAIWTTPIVQGSSSTMSGRTYSFDFVLDPLVSGSGTNTMKIYADGVEVASTVISGNWTTVRTEFGLGIRHDTGTGSWIGRLDECLVFSRAIAQVDILALHLLPATGSEANLTYGWHLDEASGSTAAPFAGATSLTLTNITWTSGRSAPTDLTISVLLMNGYSLSDIDQPSWLTCLNQMPADCGWLVSKETAREFIDIVLAGLGFVLYEYGGKFLIRRWSGLTGIAEATIDPYNDFQSASVESVPSDMPVYQWIVKYSKNNSKQDAANVTAGLAITDPDRFSYGSVDFLEVPKTDYAILDSVPGAIRMERTTALLRQKDAEDFAAYLLAIHRNGGDRKTISAFLGAAPLTPLLEVGPFFTEAGMDDSNWIVVGQQVTDGVMSISVWRPGGST